MASALGLRLDFDGADLRRLARKHFLPDMLMTKYAMAEPVTILIFGGVFMRHPKLR